MCSLYICDVREPHLSDKSSGWGAGSQGTMRRRACFNAERCPSIRQAVYHDKRLSLSDKRPSYLLADEYHLGNVEVAGSLSLDECLAVEARKHELSSPKARATKGYSPIDEAIIVLADLPEQPVGAALNHYKADQQTRLQKWRTRFEQMTGQRVLRIDVHLDEGYQDEDGTPHYNGHAHVLIDRTDDRGRVIRFTRRDDPEYRTITEVNTELQSMTAEVLGLVRGERGSKRRRLSHRQYRETMQRAGLANRGAIERVTAERDHARESELSARAAEAAAKSEAAELYSHLRDLMKTSGVARQSDYSDVRQIKTDVTKLLDAIKYWRLRSGDFPDSNSTQSSIKNSSPQGAEDEHRNRQTRTRRRNDASPVQPFLVGAVTLTGRTSRERAYAVRALQKRLLDRDRTGPLLSLSRVIREGVDRGSEDGNSGVRRSASGGRVMRPTGSTVIRTDVDVREFYADLRAAMKASKHARQNDYQVAKLHSTDAKWLVEELAKWQKLADERERESSEANARAEAVKVETDALRDERESDRIAHRRRQNYRPGFGGDGLDSWDRFPFVELEREWDQQARCTVYKSADGETWFVTTRSRVEVINQTEQSLAVALRIAAKKFDGRIEITGPQEFRERAARLAARLGIEVADADLAHIVAEERTKMLQETQQDRSGPAIEPEAGREEDPDNDEPPRGHSR